jgi:hypothetical protein
MAEGTFAGDKEQPPECHASVYYVSVYQESQDLRNIVEGSKCEQRGK